MLENKTRSVTLLCPTCAGDQFQFDKDVDEESRQYLCVDCQISFSHDEIMAANGAKIETEVNEFKTEIVSEIKSSFKKIFKGKGWSIR